MADRHVSDFPVPEHLLRLSGYTHSDVPDFWHPPEKCSKCAESGRACTVPTPCALSFSPLLEGHLGQQPCTACVAGGFACTVEAAPATNGGRYLCLFPGTIGWQYHNSHIHWPGAPGQAAVAATAAPAPVPTPNVALPADSCPAQSSPPARPNGAHTLTAERNPHELLPDGYYPELLDYLRVANGGQRMVLEHIGGGSRGGGSRGARASGPASSPTKSPAVAAIPEGHAEPQPPVTPHDRRSNTSYPETPTVQRRSRRAKSRTHTNPAAHETFRYAGRQERDSASPPKRPPRQREADNGASAGPSDAPTTPRSALRRDVNTRPMTGNTPPERQVRRGPSMVEMPRRVSGIDEGAKILRNMHLLDLPLGPHTRLPPMRTTPPPRRAPSSSTRRPDAPVTLSERLLRLSAEQRRQAGETEDVRGQLQFGTAIGVQNDVPESAGEGARGVSTLSDIIRPSFDAPKRHTATRDTSDRTGFPASDLVASKCVADSREDQRDEHAPAASGPRTPPRSSTAVPHVDTPMPARQPPRRSYVPRSTARPTTTPLPHRPQRPVQQHLDTVLTGEATHPALVARAPVPHQASASAQAAGDSAAAAPASATPNAVTNGARGDTQTIRAPPTSTRVPPRPHRTRSGSAPPSETNTAVLPDTVYEACASVAAGSSLPPRRAHSVPHAPAGPERNTESGSESDSAAPTGTTTTEAHRSPSTWKAKYWQS